MQQVVHRIQERGDLEDLPPFFCFDFFLTGFIVNIFLSNVSPPQPASRAAVAVIFVFRGEAANRANRPCGSAQLLDALTNPQHPLPLPNGHYFAARKVGFKVTGFAVPSVDMILRSDPECACTGKVVTVYGLYTRWLFWKLMYMHLAGPLFTLRAIFKLLFLRGSLRIPWIQTVGRFLTADLHIILKELSDEARTALARGSLRRKI